MIRHLVLWVCCAAPVLAAAESVLLHDTRLIDGNGGAPREHVDITLRDGRIVSIAAAARHVTASASLIVVNLSGKTVLPGLIADHSHLGLTDGTSAGNQNATTVNIKRQLRQYAAFGITTVMSLGLNQQSFYDVAPRTHADGYPGAELYGADRGFGEPDGAPPANMGISDAQVYRPATADQARSQVREAAARRPSLIKIWVDDFHGQLPLKLPPEIYRAIIDESHAAGLRVAAHVYYLSDAKRLVAEGIDVLAHGVRDAAVDAALIEAIKMRHVWYIPTLGLDESFFLFAQHPELAKQPVLAHALQPALAAQLADPAWRRKILADASKLATDQRSVRWNMTNVKTLFDAGVNIGFGTDSGATPLRIAGFAEHRELVLLVEAGLTPLQAMGTATKNAAALLKLDDRGIVAPGKLADLIVVDGDPSARIADIDRIVSVWRHGRQVAGALAAFTP